MAGRRHTAVTIMLLLVVGLLVAALTVPPDATAADGCTATWVGGTGAWDDATRWSPAEVPTADDTVCIARAAGAPAVAVRVRSSVEVAAVTVTNATLTIAPTAFVTATQFAADHAAVSGGGTLEGTVGITEFTDTRLAGVHVGTPGGLRFAGAVTFTGGARVFGSGFVDLRDGVRLVDGDGNAANHLGLSTFPLYLSGSVFVGVALGLTDVTLFAQGDVVLAKLDNLDGAGRLQASYRSDLQLGTANGGSLTLPRTITSIGVRTAVYGGDIRTPDGTDALTGLGAVDGTLDLTRTFVAGGAITVRGRLTSGSPLVAPDVRVRPGGYVDVDRITGALTCGGRCLLAGAHVGALTVLPGATPYTELTAPITVDGTARLAGDLTVSVAGRGPKPGDTLVLLTAARGVIGTFDHVTSDDARGRSVTAGYQPRYVTGTLGAAG